MSKNYVDRLCFVIILSWTTEQLCLHVFHVYNVLYIKSREHRSSVHHHVDNLVLIKHLRVVYISK